MLRVKIQNFQSLESVDFVIDGLTVITGANNAGKSATLRAIRGLFQNSRNAKQFVRHGAAQSDVVLDLGDHTVRWEKSEKVNRYTVDGKVLDKVGAGVPPEVAALGVMPVKVGDLILWPQIADQFTGQVFLVDQPGSVVAEAISDTERVAKLNGALRASESDRRTVQQTLKIRRQDLNHAQDRVQRYAGLDNVLARVTHLETDQRGLAVQESQINILRSLLVRYRDIVSRRDSLAGILTVSLPDPTSVANSRKNYLALSGWVSQVGQTRRVVQSLSGVNLVLVPQPPNPDKDIPWLESVAIRWARHQRVVAGLRGMPQSVPVAPVWDKTLETLGATLRQLRVRVARLAPAAVIRLPDPGDLALTRSNQLVLAQWHSRSHKSRDTIQQTLEQVEGLQQQIDQISCEIQDAVGDSCPVCGRGGV